jgi:hypothetical protein
MNNSQLWNMMTKFKNCEEFKKKILARIITLFFEGEITFKNLFTSPTATFSQNISKDFSRSLKIPIKESNTNRGVIYQFLHHAKITCRNIIIKHFIVFPLFLPSLCLPIALSLSWNLLCDLLKMGRTTEEQEHRMLPSSNIYDNLKECEHIFTCWDVDNNWIDRRIVIIKCIAKFLFFFCFKNRFEWHIVHGNDE